MATGLKSENELERTPLYAEHERAGARFVEYAGYRMPIQYSGLTREHRAVREAVGIFDVSHMGRLRLSGARASEVADELVTNDFSRIEVGRAMYTCACDEAGGIVDDLIVYRVAEERVVVVCNAANRTAISERFGERARGRTQLEDASGETCLLAVQGPRAFALLERLGAPAELPTGLRRFGVCELELARVRCLVARTGYTGEDGVELFCSSSDAEGLWQALLGEGQGLGALPVGLAARDTLRLEACLALYGNEIDLGTNPFEAGLGWTVKLDRGDFVGRDALRAIVAQPLKRQLVGFEVVGRGIARHGYALSSVDGAPLGHCTSGSPSPTLGKAIGLGYVAATHAGVGEQLSVDCRGRAVQASIVQTPFYRRPK